MGNVKRPWSLSLAGRDWYDAEDLLVDRVSAYGGEWILGEAFLADDWDEGDLFVCRADAWYDAEHYLIIVAGYDHAQSLTGAGNDD